MARKRISGPNPEFLGGGAPAPETKSMFSPPSGPAPIAQVAAESAAQNALQDMVREMEQARAEGRMVIAIPRSEIAPDHLARDRVAGDIEEMRSLVKSIHNHGQRTPIEVTELPEGAAHKYGLISGWRRLTALEQLRKQTGDAKHDTVLALLRKPRDSADAYVAMVEENEIRVGLSYYERARVAAEAAKRGVFEDETAALQTLFGAASKAKRSRIRSFIELYHALDGALRYPASIRERFGLTLIDALRKDAGLAARIRERLSHADLPSAEAERAMLAELIDPPKPPRKPKAPEVPHAEPADEELPNGLRLRMRGQTIQITGKGVSPVLLERLRVFLKG